MQPLSARNAPGRFSRGDKQAGNWVYNEFYPYVFDLVCNMIDPSEDTKDLVHDIFQKLYASDERFPNRESIRSMLYKIGVRHCLNYIDKRKRNEGKIAELNEDAVVPDEDAIERAESSAVCFNLVWQAINNLPVKKRTFFLLFFKEDLSNRQLAERLGISIQTAANKKTIILNILKEDISRMAGNEISELYLLIIILLYEIF